MQTEFIPERLECVAFINEIFEKSLADSISSLLGEDADVSPAGEAQSLGDALWFRSILRTSASSYIAFGVPRTAWIDLGARILSGGNPEEKRPADDVILSTLKEISAQVSGSIAAAINRRYQRRVDMESLDANPQESGVEREVYRASFTVSLNHEPALPLQLLISRTLVEELTPGKSLEPALPHGLVPHNTVDAKKLDLLLDVEMPVSISMGRSQMALKDVVRLTAGSVVELNRNVSDPVDIVVNNCVVARGDVVVIDGNFGIRIKEVLSKEDRLQHLSQS